MGGKVAFASLKRTNGSAMKRSKCCAVHSAVYTEPRTTSRRGKKQNFPLTNAAGLCRAVGELPARKTIRRKKEMERESNYPSAKADFSLFAGPSPGQADVGSEVCTGWSYDRAGKWAPRGPLWAGRWLSAHHRELRWKPHSPFCYYPPDTVVSQPATNVCWGHCPGLGSKWQRFTAGYSCVTSWWSMGKAVQVQREEGRCLAGSLSAGSWSNGLAVQAQRRRKEGGGPCVPLPPQ